MAAQENRASLEKRLRKRSPDEVILVATRAALRAIPQIADNLDGVGPRRLADLFLATIRACVVARAVAVYPALSGGLKPAAVAAARAAAAVAEIAGGMQSAIARAAGSAADAIESSVISNASFAAEFAGLSNKNIWPQIQADIRDLEQIPAGSIVSIPLWRGNEPQVIAKNWEKLKNNLRAQGRWEYWINLYEAIKDGRTHFTELDDDARLALEFNIYLLDDELWAQGAPTINAEIERLITAALPARVGKQGPGPHFGLDAEDLVTPAAHWEYDEVGNVPQRIRALLPLARQAAADLIAALPPNDPYNLHRDTGNYLAAVACEPERVDWGVLYGLGVMVENAAAAAERPLPDRLLPLLEDPAKKALDSLRTLHLNLIMASGEGRALMEQADALRLTREEQQALRSDAKAIAKNLADAPDVAKPEAAERLESAAEAMAQGPHAERGSEFGLAAIGNISVVLVSAATLASFVPIGVAHAGVAGGAVAAAPAWLGYEALKKSQMFADATKALGGKYDALVGASREAIYWQLAALSPFRAFVRANEAELRRIAAKSTRMRWALRYIDFIVNTDGSHLI